MLIFAVVKYCGIPLLSVRAGAGLGVGVDGDRLGDDGEIADQYDRVRPGAGNIEL